MFIRFIFLVGCIFFLKDAISQSKKFSIAVRIPFQIDFKKATFKDTHFPFPIKEHSAIATNWGIDLLVQKETSKKLNVHIGIGYLRDRFNFKRFYDHQLLNFGSDSLLIGTATDSYTYHLVRLPISLSYKMLNTEMLNLQLGFENIFNLSFLQVYNGAKPFVNAKNKLSDLRYFGNSIMLFTRLSKPAFKTSSFQLEPYLRISHTYRRDPILFETNKEKNARTFDAFGLAIRYLFIL